MDTERYKAALIFIISSKITSRVIFWLQRHGSKIASASRHFGKCSLHVIICCTNVIISSCSPFQLSVILVFCLTAILSAFVFHDHHHRKMFVGSIGLAASIAMYGSPLVVMKEVIQTKSVEFMPFYLSLFSFLASSLWMAYGLLSHDLFLASPNLVGSPLGILQLLLYCKYRKVGITEESKEWDREKNYKQMPHLKASAEKEEEKSMQSLKVTPPAKDDEKSTVNFQLVVTDATKGQT